MNKTLILQVDIKNFDHESRNWWRPYPIVNELYYDSKCSALAYAEKTGSDYFCLSNPWLGENVSPVYQKLYIYKMFEQQNYEKILMLDADVIINDVCPNIFAFDTLSAVPNVPEGQDYHKVNQTDFHGFDRSYSKFFNSGVCMIPREFYELTKDHWYNEFSYYNQDNSKGMQEQTVMNVLAYKYYPHEKINILPLAWGVWWQDSDYMNHYAAGRTYVRKRDKI